MTRVAATPAELNAELVQRHVQVHQPGDPPLLTAEPMTQVKPWVWRWEVVRPIVDRVLQVVGLERGGERRTLRLVNPGLPYGTTHTLWAGIQSVWPGEVATAHRHTAAAFRFIIEGSGASTTVDGTRYPMEPGDVLLTPSWAWHDHRHAGSDPMLWLDGLDIPLIWALNASFFEPYEQPEQPVLVPGGERECVFKWARTRRTLDELAAGAGDPFDDVALEFRNPLNGDSALPTIGLGMQMLRPGVRTRAHRHTSSTLYHIVHGSGATIIDGEPFSWEARDFLVVPPWTWHQHRNQSRAKPAVLFQMNDVPVMKALGLYREDAGP